MMGRPGYSGRSVIAAIFALGAIAAALGALLDKPDAVDLLVIGVILAAIAGVTA